jgi:2-polyprenyl-6-hydroxyphenyl methylase/3-demethylubiquinone-9 3-methyltransferase
MRSHRRGRNAGLFEGILSRYPHATSFQRWHMRGRLRLCPYPALLKHLTGRGSVLDIGCGFGHLAWFLTEERPDLAYFGADVDPAKIALAQGCPVAAAAGSVPPSFRLGDVTAPAALSGWPERFGNIVLLDVLYLLPWSAQERLLDWALSRLAPGPGSALVIKSMEVARGLSGFRALAEEWVMVHLLRRTRHSGTITGARPASAYAEFAHSRGFRSEVEDLGTFNPSYYIRIHR